MNYFFVDIWYFCLYIYSFTHIIAYMDLQNGVLSIQKKMLWGLDLLSRLGVPTPQNLNWETDKGKLASSACICH